MTTPWVVETATKWFRIFRLGGRVAIAFLNPFNPLFLHPLAFEIWYFMTHEQEAADRINATAVVDSGVAELSFADDLTLMETNDEPVDLELEMLLEEAENKPGSASNNIRSSQDRPSIGDRQSSGSSRPVSMKIVLRSEENISWG